VYLKECAISREVLEFELPSDPDQLAGQLEPDELGKARLGRVIVWSVKKEVLI